MLLLDVNNYLYEGCFSEQYFDLSYSFQNFTNQLNDGMIGNIDIDIKAGL